MDKFKNLKELFEEIFILERCTLVLCFFFFFFFELLSAT